ncbi:MAG: hypothetical protein FH748_11150 [Balneolaceae bacterium]|nr:hypothetical protein [Balneolaceae bacterium]
MSILEVIRNYLKQDKNARLWEWVRIVGTSQKSVSSGSIKKSSRVGLAALAGVCEKRRGKYRNLPPLKNEPRYRAGFTSLNYGGIKEGVIAGEVYTKTRDLPGTGKVVNKEAVAGATHVAGVPDRRLHFVTPCPG